MSNQLTKREAIDLLSLVNLIAVSKNGEQELDNMKLTEGQIDKMMRVIVHLFDGKEEKANTYIRNRLKKLLKKLDNQDDIKSQIKSFKETSND